MICCYSLLFYVLLLPFLLIKMPMSYMDKMMWEESAVRAAWTVVAGIALKLLAKAVLPWCDKWSGAMKYAYMSVIFFAAGLFANVFYEKVWKDVQRKIERENLGAKIPVA